MQWDDLSGEKEGYLSGFSDQEGHAGGEWAGGVGGGGEDERMVD